MIFYSVLLIAGYVAAIFTWERVRTYISGAESEVIRLEAKVVAIKAKITGAV